MTITAWHAAALQDLENTSMTVSEVAKKYGRSDKTIEKLLYQSGVVRRNPGKRRGPKRRENGLPLSRQHHAVGIRIGISRAGEGSRSYADRLGVSPLVLAQMEVGQYDFKFSQLLRISEVTKTPIAELITTFESNLYKGRLNAHH